MPVLARLLPLALLALATLPASGPASAQCQLCVKDGAAQPSAIGDSLFPITVTVETELDFSRMVIASAAAGAAVLDARTGARSVSGGLSELGGIPMRGTIRISGRPLRRVRVTLPARVMLTAPDGGSAELVDLRTDTSGNPTLGVLGTAELRFGGTLRVPAGTAGDFRGRVPIEVDYE